MKSGIFAMGSMLNIDIFKKMLVPSFIEKGYSITNMMPINSELLSGNGFYNGYSILASIIGDEFQKTIDEVLMYASKNIPDEYRSSGIGNNHFSRFDHFLDPKLGWESEQVFVGLFETIGVYDNEETASQLFPAIAQGYLLEDVKKKVSDVSGTMKRFLNSKVRDI